MKRRWNVGWVETFFGPRVLTWDIILFLVVEYKLGIQVSFPHLLSGQTNWIPFGPVSFRPVLSSLHGVTNHYHIMVWPTDQLLCPTDQICDKLTWRHWRSYKASFWDNTLGLKPKHQGRLFSSFQSPSEKLTTSACLQKHWLIHF